MVRLRNEDFLIVHHMSNKSREARLYTTLSIFNPVTLVIENQSARHHGHAGDDGSGESHFHIYMVSAHFENQSKVARHRSVMQAVAPEFASGLHALGLDLFAPSEKL